MKVAILGSGLAGVSVALISALQARHQVVVIDSIDDVNPDNADILICEDQKVIAMCGHPLGNLGVDCFPQEITIPDIDNSFRGGSRGKGGKIKYARR